MPLHANENIRDVFHPFVDGKIFLNREAIRGFSTIVFFFHTPSDHPSLSRKLEKTAIHELEKFGRVFPRILSFPNSFDEEMPQQHFLRKAFLIFDLKHVHDPHGHSLPVLKASLIFEAPVTINQNKEFSNCILWMRETFINSSSHKELKKEIVHAFKFLVNEFAADFFAVNFDLPVEPVFHFVLF